MKYKILGLLGLFLVMGCVNVSQKKPNLFTFQSVEIQNVLNCDCSIRALHTDEQRIFFAGSNGKFGYLNTADNSVEYLGTIRHREELPEFRGIVHTPQSDFILSAGTPALLYRVNLFGQRKLIYEENKEGTFYDAMAFWNNKEGLIIGDPTEGCMDFLTTRNAGRNWTKINCEALGGKTGTDEVAFAASNSNIAIVDQNTWVISGGTQTRIYFSPDKGKNWRGYDTPLIGGKSTTGGYSVDFYNDKIGFIIGGDYTDPEANEANKALTINGGKTWELVANGAIPGYMSSVKFIPESEGQELVAVGPSGIFYSKDQGNTWQNLSKQGFHTIDFLNDFTAYAAGDGGIVQLTFLESPIEE